MGVRIGTYCTTINGANLPATAAETVLLTTPVVLLPTDSAAVLLTWCINCQVLSGATGLVFNIRRGTTTGGTAIGAGTWTETVSGIHNYQLSGMYVDVFFASATAYCLTIAQPGYTSTGAFQSASLAALVL